MSSQLENFLRLAAQAVSQKDGDLLKSLFVVDFDSIDGGQRQSYQELNRELSQTYSNGKDGALEELCRQALVKATAQDPWNSLTSLLVTYFRFVGDYLTYSLRDKLFKIKDIAKYVEPVMVPAQHLIPSIASP